MNVLAIDCTRKNLVVAVKNNGKWRCCRGNGQSSVSLNRAIEQTLKEAGLDYGGIDAFCCNVGPGSFTGIRVSVATIKGLNFGFGKKMISVNTFELMAYNNAGEVTALIADNKGCFRAGLSDGRLVSEPEHIPFDSIKRGGSEIVFDADGDYAEALTAVCDRKAANNEFCTDFEPLYVRKSQAEELYGKS